MVKIPMQLQMFIIKITLFFISKKRYLHKIEEIIDSDEKHKGFDLGGWEFRKAVSADGSFTHRYYYFPSEKDGAPFLLFLHGLNFDGRSFVNMKTLAVSHTLIAYDFPEESDRYTGNLMDFVSLIKDFAVVMQLGDFSLAGVSFGGVVALRFAAEQASPVVKNLICISTPLSGYDKKEVHRSIISDIWLNRLADYQVYWLIEKMTDRFRRGFPKSVRVKFRGMMQMRKPGFYRQIIAALRGYSAVRYAEKIDSKVLVMHGAKDTLFSPGKEIEKFRKLLPRAKTLMIENGTHAMTFLQGEMIAGCIREFIDK